MRLAQLGVGLLATPSNRHVLVGPLAVSTVTRAKPVTTPSPPPVSLISTRKLLQIVGSKRARVAASVKVCTNGVALQVQPCVEGTVANTVPLMDRVKLLLPAPLVAQSAWLIVNVIAVGTIGLAWPAAAKRALASTDSQSPATRCRLLTTTTRRAWVATVRPSNRIRAASKPLCFPKVPPYALESALALDSAGD